MIKLTLNPGSHSKAFIFDKELIIIGDGPQEVVDLSLPKLGLHQTHLKILFKDGSYYLVNQANDPFVTLNGVPFGKKKLKNEDLLQIRDKILRIDEIAISAPEEKKIPPPFTPEIPSSQPVIAKTNPETEESNAFPDVESLAQEDDLEGWFPADIADITLDNIVANSSKEAEPEIKSGGESTPSSESSSEGKRWNLNRWAWFASFLLLFTTIFGAITVEIYFRAKNQSGGEEVKAAESLADFAMAFTYAHVYNIVPQKQNFSDPEFLKNNLIALLSSASIPCGNIDAQGQFSNCPYLLRLYSNQDLSRFLLIAQPAPSLSQWLFPKDAIIIDSTLMTLSKISDLKVINRLLANANPFEGSNGKELIEIIKNLEIISLPHLSHVTKKREFAPPSILGYIRPGAENLVYNAPRYYQFGETFVKKALASSSHAQESTPFLVEIERLLNYENLVFYTSQGMQAAHEARQALFKLAPENNFYTAYLQLSSQGEIIGSRLILDQENKSDGQKKPEEVQDEPIALLEKLETDNIHPALHRVNAFKESSKADLKPFIQRLLLTLEEDVERGQIKIAEEFKALLELRETQQKKFKELLSALEKEFPDLPEELKIKSEFQNRLFYDFRELADPFTPLKNKVFSLIIN